MAATETSAVPPLDIRVDDLTSAPIAAFLAEHLRDMHATSPPESVHALDLAGLRQPTITFWSVWSHDELRGCAALKHLDERHAELKSMRTAPQHRGKGLGGQILQFVMEEARRRGYRRLSLETGSQPYFLPARSLYAARGFLPCPPFGPYTDDPNSVYMTRELG